MSTAAVPTTEVVDQAVVDRNAELFQGYLVAQMDDPDRMEHLPEGTTLVLLPRGDDDGIEAALTMAAAVAR
jgi:hypothetical protein